MNDKPKLDEYGRIDRTDLTRDDLLQEIAFAEAILDGMGAKTGLTLWGRIRDIKTRLENESESCWWCEQARNPDNHSVTVCPFHKAGETS